MAERESPKDSRNFKIDHKMAAVLGSAAGGVFGGIGYGATRLLADSDLANRVGVGVAADLGTFTWGLMAGIGSQQEAEKLAIQGMVGRATIKGWQAALEAGTGVGLSGALTGYEFGGSEGALVGGIIGTIILTPGFLMMSRDLKATGIVFRDVIHPALDPKNFPQFNVSKDALTVENDIAVEHPPVYQAQSITDMQGFRQAQVDEVLAKAPLMRRQFKVPEVVLGRMNAAIFIIPDLAHFPAFDPQEDDISLKGLIKDPNISMQLTDRDGNKIVVRPHKDSTLTIWPGQSEFEGGYTQIAEREFNENRWKYWREVSWKRTAAILAERTTTRPKISGTTFGPLQATDTYKLIDIFIEEPGKRDRIWKKAAVEEKGFVPEQEPMSI